MLTQNIASISGPKGQKEFNTIKEVLTEEEESIIEWIKENFSKSYSNCRKVNKIEHLFNGVALAEIVSHYLNEDEKEIFLNQVEVIDKIENSDDVEIANNNLNAVMIQISGLFYQALRNMKSKKITSRAEDDLVEMTEFSIKLMQNFNCESIVHNKHRMRNFMMQVVMILPEISPYFLSTKEVFNKMNKLKSQNKENTEIGSKTLEKEEKLQKNMRQESIQQKFSTQMKEINNSNEPVEFFPKNNIEELSSIIGYSTINYCSLKQDVVSIQEHMKNKLPNKRSEEYNEIQEDGEKSEKEYKRSESEAFFENKVEKLLNWMQSSFNLDLSTFLEPYILLGELVNCVFAPNRLKDNEKPIKPTHYELGSYSVYKKALDVLTSVERLNKNNLMKLMKEVEQGKVNENTFWNLVEDIYLMSKNKVSEPLVSVNKKPQRKQSVKKLPEQEERLPTYYDENINIDNIKNQSVSDMLRKQAEEGRKPNELKDAPLYCEEVIRETELWLENEMGMSHPLGKSKPQSKAVILENPLLNGTLYAKIIQRLKIGSAKGIITPLEKKHMKINIEIVKNELLNRGYECVRKLNIYKPTYNFYIGLLSEIREIYQNKESNNKKLILNDKQRRQLEELQSEILEDEREDIQLWLKEEFNFNFDNKNFGISLKQLKEIIESTVNVNFLKETTEKIRLTNYSKLFDFFRSIGFSHYSNFKIEDLLNDSQSNRKKAQNLRWIILRDLKIIKGKK